MPSLPLRIPLQATLRTMTDRACARAFRRAHARGNGGEEFDGSRMICGIDPNGRAPLSSGCNGDSGGPLMAGTYHAPRILGKVVKADRGYVLTCFTKPSNDGGHSTAWSTPRRIPH